jgi:hypothetical protein
LNYQNYQKNLAIVLSIAGLVFLIVVYFANLKVAEMPGVGKDFFIQWTNTRTFLLDGFSPYQQEAHFQLEQQSVLSNLTFNGDLQADIEPLYGFLLYLPFIVVPSFQHALAAWLVMNEILLLFICWFLYRLSGWQGRRSLFFFISLTVIAWKSMLEVLLGGGNSILILCALIAVLYTLKYGMYELAGVLLAIVSIKISLLWLPVIFILLYCSVRHYQKTQLWFFVSILFVSVSLMLLDPVWIRDYFIATLAQLVNHPHSLVKVSSISQLFNESYFSHLSMALEPVFRSFGVRLGNVFTMIIIGLMLMEWFSMGKRDDKGIFWMFSLTILVSVWIGMNDKTSVFAFFMPILFLFISLFYDRWQGRGKLLYWLLPVFILALNWVVFMPAEPSLILLYGAYPFVFLVLMFWIRWWALSKNYLVYEWKTR